MAIARARPRFACAGSCSRMCPRSPHLAPGAVVGEHRHFRFLTEMGLRRPGLNRYAAGQGTISNIESIAMGVRQYMRPDIAASAIAHLSVLGLVIFFTEVHPFGSVTAEPIAVDIVAADQLEKAEAKPDQATRLPNTDSLTKEDAAAGLEKPAAPTPSAAPQKTIAAEPQKETDTQ